MGYKNISLFKWFQKPYYYNDSNNFKLLFSFGVGLFIFLALYFLKPFGIEKTKFNLLAYCLGYFAITTSVILFYFFVVAKFFSDFFNTEKWTVGKHLSVIIIVTFFICVSNWLYNLVLMQSENHNRDLDFYSIATHTLIIGVFPLFAYIYFDERYYRSKHTKISNEVRQKLQKRGTKERKFSSNEVAQFFNANLKIDIKDIVYINSQGNYACFFSKSENGEIKESLLRKTLTSVGNELGVYNNFVRCHKSYIVNSDYVTDISGNARGYHLHFEEIDKEIPVSRNFKKEELLQFI